MTNTTTTCDRCQQHADPSFRIESPARARKNIRVGRDLCKPCWDDFLVFMTKLPTPEPNTSPQPPTGLSEGIEDYSGITPATAEQWAASEDSVKLSETHAALGARLSRLEKRIESTNGFLNEVFERLHVLFSHAKLNWTLEKKDGQWIPYGSKK